MTSSSYDLLCLEIVENIYYFCKHSYYNYFETTQTHMNAYISRHTQYQPPPKNVSVSHVAAVLKPLKRSERIHEKNKVELHTKGASKTHFGTLHANSRLVKKTNVNVGWLTNTMLFLRAQVVGQEILPHQLLVLLSKHQHRWHWHYFGIYTLDSVW